MLSRQTNFESMTALESIDFLDTNFGSMAAFTESRDFLDTNFGSMAAFTESRDFLDTNFGSIDALMEILDTNFGSMPIYERFLLLFAALIRLFLLSFSSSVALICPLARSLFSLETLNRRTPLFHPLLYERQTLSSLSPPLFQRSKSTRCRRPATREAAPDTESDYDTSLLLEETIVK
ncbi:hypothetical protein FCM35_KLT00662 [Carex littledalei]|uniref:Uncharacterized protein n=1 Tax=Carex littledalei TaxID=544730 RepID=A0A833RIW9_9POAL|nr:hypothetical protein FCM35_KLT00662 [Carex littledalei]